MNYTSSQENETSLETNLSATVVGIPIHNIYHILSYAWGILDTSGRKQIAESSFPCPIDFIAYEICRASQAAIKTQIATVFRTEEEKSQRPRGKINFTNTIKSPDFAKRVINYSMPVVTTDNNENQILKASLNRIKNNSMISMETRRKAHSLKVQLNNVSDIFLSKSTFHHSQNLMIKNSYKLPISLCRILFEASAPADKTGRLWFEEFIRNDSKMRKVFEVFLRNFYAKHISTARVGATRTQFFAISNIDGDQSLVPNMNTDVVIDYLSGPKVVVDAKFVKHSSAFFHGKRMLHSPHLYQILSYVNNFQLQERGREIFGLVVYPEYSESLDIKFSYSNATYRFATVNLSTTWDKVEKRLLDLVP